MLNEYGDPDDPDAEIPSYVSDEYSSNLRVMSQEPEKEVKEAREGRSSCSAQSGLSSSREKEKKKMAKYLIPKAISDPVGCPTDNELSINFLLSSNAEILSLITD